MQEVFLTLPTGTVVRDRYVIEDLLGKGGFGSVYLVRDRRVKGNLFALKEVVDPNKQERDRFTFECEVLKRLDHHALPRVYRAFSDDANIRAYMLMDYIEGPNLEVLRQRQPDKRLPLAQVLRIMAPIIDAVAYLHNQNPSIIHRDIKPANIIVPVTGDGAMLVDFGIAKEDNPNTTTTTVRRCSPGYGAPEQYSSGTNTRTDIYGLGATFYTLLTGDVPTDAFHRLTHLGSRGTDSLLRVDELVPSISAEVADVIQRAMALDSNNRFPTVEDFWKALLDAADTADLTEIPETPAPIALSELSPDTSLLLHEEKQEDEKKDASTYRDFMENAVTVADQRKPLPQPSVAYVRQSRVSGQIGSTRRRGLVALLAIVLLLISGIGGGIWFSMHNLHSGNNLTQSQTTPAKNTHGATATPTQPVTLGTTPTTGTQHVMNIAGQYNDGLIYYNPTQFHSTMGITLSQQENIINGQMNTFGPPLSGATDPFSGSIDGSNHFSFTVQSSQGNILFYGKVVVEGGVIHLQGNYCNVNSKGCSVNSPGDGNWDVAKTN